MDKINRPSSNRATLYLTSTLGFFCGIGGLIHAVGEIRQGNVAPESVFIPSWTDGPIAEQLDGDPALTIIPNLLATGISTLIIATVIIIYSLFIFKKRKGGSALIPLSILLFLVGGGGGPPTFGLIAGIAGLGVNSTYPWWRRHINGSLTIVLAKLWPWVFAICGLNLALLFGGHTAIFFVKVPNSAEFFLTVFLVIILFEILSAITGIAYDIRNREAVE